MYASLEVSVLNADLLSVINEEVESIEEEKKEEIPVIRPSTDILENPFYEN